MSNDEFKKRFLSFHPLIYRISYSILENRDDADDVAQEVYIKLWEQRSNLENIRNDEAFVVTMTKNLSIDLLRNNHRKTTSIIENKEMVCENREEERMDARNELSHLMKCMSDLPQAQQEVIRLRHFADLSIREIAETTRQTETNIRQLLSRARRTMKEKLNRNGNEYK
ncbi:RNA polymerase sigma factor SigV [bioreactor metagenome]|uniref:RNA polymerase sigma factor SigV n=2 Tax=root TaxID=1 RepID=A0A644XQT6_9ZZZZ